MNYTINQAKIFTINRPFAARPSAPINNIISSKCTFLPPSWRTFLWSASVSIVAREIHQVTG